MSADKGPILGPLLRQLGRGLVLATVLSGFLNVLALTIPLFTMQVYDRVMSSRSIDTLVMLAIIAAGALVLMGVLDYLRARVLLVIGDIMARRLNVPTLQAAITASLAGGPQQAAAGQAIRDLNEMRGFVTGSAVTLPMDLLWTPVYLVVLFLLSPIYGGLALGAGVLLLIAGTLTSLSTRGTLAAANESSAKAFSDVASTVRHAEAIEAMGMLPAVARRWRGQQRDMSALMDRGVAAVRAMAAASRTLRLMLQIAIIGAGAVLVMDRAVSPGSMMAAAILIGRLLAPFEGMIEGWRQWVFAASALERVRVLLAGKQGRRDTIPLPRPSGRLLVDRLFYVPPGSDKPLLKGISFQLEAGQILGIIGPSGAGKSTLARLMVGVWEPTSGGIYLDGHSTFLWERESFGQAVGYVPQSVALLDGTIRENIARMQEADARAVVQAARMAGVHDLIGRLPFGYDTPVGDGAYSLSGGQRQRIALARALFGNPALLVLDEPNSNLDNAGEQALLQAIRAAKAAGSTVVMIAHRPSIMQAADKILVLKDGIVEQFGDRAAILPGVVPAGTQPGAPAVLAPPAAAGTVRRLVRKVP